MQAACNRAKWTRFSDSQHASMEAQAHACWESEKGVHLARLHAACMAARPFRPLVWAKVEGHL